MWLPKKKKKKLKILEKLKWKIRNERLFERYRKNEGSCARSLDNRVKQGNETVYTLELVTNCDMVSFVVVRQHSLWPVIQETLS